MNQNDRKHVDRKDQKAPVHPAGIKPTDTDANARMTNEGDVQSMDDAQPVTTGRDAVKKQASRPNPSGTPGDKNPNKPMEREERSRRADVGDADEQADDEGTKQGSEQQDPPATLPQGRPHEKRDTL